MKSGGVNPFQNYEIKMQFIPIKYAAIKVFSKSLIIGEINMRPGFPIKYTYLWLTMNDVCDNPRRPIGQGARYRSEPALRRRDEHTLNFALLDQRCKCHTCSHKFPCAGIICK